jgi:hypothetical protein
MLPSVIALMVPGGSTRSTLSIRRAGGFSEGGVFRPKHPMRRHGQTRARRLIRSPGPIPGCRRFARVTAVLGRA